MYALQSLVDSEQFKTLPRETQRMLEKQYNDAYKRANCKCDPGYYTCDACVNVYRREQYGQHIHNIECVCNACTYGDLLPRHDY